MSHHRFSFIQFCSKEDKSVRLKSQKKTYIFIFGRLTSSCSGNWPLLSVTRFLYKDLHVKHLHALRQQEQRQRDQQRDTWWKKPWCRQWSQEPQPRSQLLCLHTECHSLERFVICLFFACLPVSFTVLFVYLSLLQIQIYIT